MSSMSPYILSRVLKEPHRASKTKVQRKIGAVQTLTSTKIRGWIRCHGRDNIHVDPSCKTEAYKTIFYLNYFECMRPLKSL